MTHYILFFQEFQLEFIPFRKNRFEFIDVEFRLRYDKKEVNT